MPTRRIATLVACSALLLACAQDRPRARPFDAAWGARLDERGLSFVLRDARVEVALHAIGREGTRAEVEDASVLEVEAGADLARGEGVVEWWRERANGLEHGVTLADRPRGHGALEVAIATDAQLSEQAPGVLVLARGGRPIGRCSEPHAWDADGRALPTTLRARDTEILIEVDDRDARYPVVVDPMFVAIEEAIILPTTGGANAAFGNAVAVSADDTRAVIGAPFATTSAGMSGNARVFLRSGTSWSEEATLIASDAAANDELGLRVAMASDGSRAIVGAPLHDLAAGTTDTGAAHVFVRAGTTWTDEAELTGSGARAGDHYGAAVAMSGDGLSAIVGAPLRNNTRAAAGIADIWTLIGSNWVSSYTVVDPGPSTGDHFGCAVAMSADASTVVVGACSDDNPRGTDAGDAFVFVHSGVNWNFTAQLLPPDTSGGDALGTSVALSADGSRAIVGAPLHNVGGAPSAGAAYVFHWTGSAWVLEAELTRATPGIGDGLGVSVAISADGSRVVVGASQEANGVSAGAAHLFLRTGTTWAEDAPLYETGPASGDTLGGSVSISGDGTRMLVGAPGDDTSAGVDAGSVRVFVLGTPIATGSACTTSAACASGACVDGFCCGTACGGGSTTDCMACAHALTGLADGTCGTLVTGASSIVCRASAGSCDVAEHCDGASSACPTDAFVASGTSCRASSGTCDPSESCTGSSGACPSDVITAMGTACRAAVDVCDRAETCDGVSGACPVDAHLASGTICRASMGPCDVADVCDGTTSACIDVVATSGTVCAVASGACDVADVCDGMTTACAVRVASASTTCRASTNPVCDPAETCDGASTSCPADLDTCSADGGIDASATADAAVADAGTDAAAIDAATTIDAASVIDAATPIDASVVDATAHDAAATRADGASADAQSTVDASAPPPMAPGCSCRVAGPDRSPLVLALLMAIVWLASRRRASRT